MIKNGAAAAWATVAVAAGCRSGAALPDGFQGIVEYDERALAFEVPGRIQRVEVRRGEVVQPGQVLAALDDTLQRLVVEARKQDEAAAQADLALLEAGSRKEDIEAAAEDLAGATAGEEEARKSDTRVRALFAQGALPQAEVDKTSAALDRAVSQRKSLAQRLSALRHGPRVEEIARARARVDQASSELALEEERLARYALRASAAGEVLDVAVEPGELATIGTVAVKVADTTHPYVDVFVPQGQLETVRVGAKAAVRIDAAGTPLSAVVEFVSPQTEFTPKFIFSPRERPNLVVRVRVRIDDAERRLHSGVPGFARIAP